METALPFLTYGLPLAVVWGIFIYLRRKSEKRAMARLEESNAAGLNRPASLHPLIDPFLCLGCGACVRACPEGDILGLINGKAQLLEPSNCIGHGACAAACPLDAITLVFGTAERGVEIPEVGPDFQTNVPGIYIAGELGGMGLIRNAIEQGRQAVGYIRDQRGRASGDQLDLVIVGAGPAGFAAALAAKEAGLNFTILEQESLGGTVAHFPRGKLVMTAPAELPIYGMAKFRETSKEDLLQFWQDVAAQTGLTISYEEQVEEIQPAGDGFTLRTTRGSYDTRSVLLAIGRRGTPRKLEVPGEDQPKVVYRLADPAQYQGQSVLIVGGGDSAIEAAVTLSQEPGTRVTMSYRGDGFARAKPKNRARAEAAVENGHLTILFSSQVQSIGADHVQLSHEGRTLTLENDAVIICAGGILPTGFLRSIGISIETKHGTA